MANRYWVTGGDGNWNSTTNWSTASGGASGASVPGSSDAAILNASSGSGTVTLDISPTIQTLTCTGFTGTLAFGTNTISLNSTGTIFTGATTMTVTGTPLIICTNNSATSRTIVPTVVTEANSISFRVTAGTGSVNLNAGGYKDLDFTDGTNPTGFAGSLTGGAISVYGNFKASTGMTVTATTNAITFAATSGTKTIDTAGVTFDRPFTFSGVGGTWQLQSALTSGATRTCTLTSGTLDLAGYTLTTGLFSSTNSNVRAIAFGTGKIVLTSTTGTVLSMSTATNFTYTGTSRIEVTASGAGRTITPPSTNAVESNALSIYVTTGSDTVTIGGSARFLNFDLTGFAGTLTYASTSRYFGDLVFVSGMTLGTVSGSFIFVKTSGTQTITSAGKTIGAGVTIDASGATVSLQDALSLTGTLTLANGTLTTNGYSIAAAIFSSSNTNVRTLNLGASTVSITGTGTIWSITDPTNMTLNAGTSTITTTGTTGAITFNGGGLTYYNVTFGATYYNCTLTGANTFNNLTLSSPAGVGRRSLSFDANQTINGTLTCSGSAANSRSRLVGGTGGTTLTVATVAALADVDFAGITAAGASSPWSGTRLGNFGLNTNITFAAPKTVYWNQPAGGNWSDVAWATSSGGAVNINNFPLGQDTAILDNTGVGASSTIVIDYGWILPALSAGSLTNALTINVNTVNSLTAGCAGPNVTLSSAITLVATAGPLAFNPLSNGTVTTAGVVFPMQVTLIGSLGVTMALGDNFTCTGKINLVAGTVNLNGKTLSCDNFDSTFGDLAVRTIAFNGGQIDVTGSNATVWACEDLTNFSYTGTPTVNFTYSGSTGSRTITNGNTAGATESNVVDLNITAGSDTIVFGIGSSVRNMNYTGFSGIGSTINNGFIYGNLTLSATQTIAANSNSTTFAATSGTKTITTNGVTIDRPLIFQGIGGTWSLQDALTLGATRALGLFAGTLNTNGYAVSCGRFNASDAGATGNRTLNLGATSFTVVGTSTATMSWQIETTTYTFTLNAGTSTIYMAEAYSGLSTQDFIGGGKTYYNVVYSGGEASTIYGSNTFNSISNSTQPLALSFEAGTTQTVNQFNVSGTSGNLVTLASATPGSQWSLAKNIGTKVLVSYCSITDSAATPAGYWFAPTSQGNVDGGNNTGWNFAATGSFNEFFMFL